MAKIWRGGSVMGREDRVGRRGRGGAASKDAADTAKKGLKVERLRALWPELRALVGPRRNLLLLGLVLIAINRVTGLVLPATTRYVIDDVIGKRRVELLLPILGAVVGATVVQALTSFALTQTLSKAAQKLIADLRRRVQAHIGRLPVAFYDANKTGNLVSRIMSDVEGVRNLVGTGLVEFIGRPSGRGRRARLDAADQPGHDGRDRVHVAHVRVRPLPRLRHDAADLPRALEDPGRSHRAPHRIAGRRARGEGLSRGGARGSGLLRRRGAAAREHPEDAHRDVGAQPGLDPPPRHRGRGRDVRRRAADPRRQPDRRRALHLHDAARIPGRARLPGRGHRHPAHGSAGGPGAHAGDPARAAGGRRSAADGGARTHRGPCRVRRRDVLLRRRARGPRRHLLPIGAGHGDGPRRALGLRQVHDHRADRRLPRPGARRGHRGRRGPLDRPSRLLSNPARRRPPGHVPLRRHDPRERRLLAAGRDRGGDPARLPSRARGRVRGAVRGGLRDDRGRARRQALRRPAPARLDRARHPGRSAHPDPGRGDVEPRLGVRGAHPGRPLAPHEGTHHVRHRAPPVHHPPRRPDPGRRGGPHRRARHARVALRGRTAATTTCTRASTASSRTCSSPPAKATRCPPPRKRKRKPRGRVSPTRCVCSGAES